MWRFERIFKPTLSRGLETARRSKLALSMSQPRDPPEGSECFRLDLAPEEHAASMPGLWPHHPAISGLREAQNSSTAAI